MAETHSGSVRSTRAGHEGALRQLCKKYIERKFPCTSCMYVGSSTCMYGQPAPYRPFRAFAARHDLLVLSCELLTYIITCRGTCRVAPSVLGLFLGGPHLPMFLGAATSTARPRPVDGVKLKHVLRLATRA